MSTSEHLLKIKKEIAESFPNFEANATQAWREVVTEISQAAERVVATGPEYIPQVKFSDLATLSPEEISEIKRKGTVVIKDVVDDTQAAGWKTSLEEFVKANPTGIQGIPEGNLQFFQLYWTRPQVEARSHPNMLATCAWLNNLYNTPPDANIEGVDLSTPLTYADRFRIRHPGGHWGAHPPHVDGGTLERWEDPVFRSCFNDILCGKWRSHDPYDLSGRLNARASIYNRPNQASIFRSFQGWLAISETGPTRGTLRVFPDVLLSNAYLILRPFFRSTVGPDAKDYLSADNWKFDISTPDFPGILARDGGYYGPKPTPEEHPHMLLDKMMTSVPEVSPGDAVFWHCDVVHAVEPEHLGTIDSAVMYIPAVPSTPMNQAYVEKQRETFLKGVTPPDFPRVPVNEADLVGIGKADDILSPMGRRAMGFPISVA
ncbi:hypothetical protein V5O48_014226 [Marasmius crinis-equi]|uniref:DUF1479-domain-containing protein n=1 Tax=Marasmius crinis-equi TaxID=585013 RepID=A0ABR3EXX4_9AGAR